MCGIFGVSGKIASSSVDLCIQSLKKLEYRGYDSSGIALIDEGGIEIIKSTGKVNLLEEKVKHLGAKKSVSIAHTRWATHGGVVEMNAHPLFDEHKNTAVVHNGIIENFYEIKEQLISEGVKFSSQTDTEVIAQLLEKNYRGNLEKAMQAVLQKVDGSFAIACIHKNHPYSLLVTTREKPLIIALDTRLNQVLVTSDTNALYDGEFNIFYLPDNHICHIENSTINLFDKNLSQQTPQFTSLKVHNVSHNKGEFAHFMLKEIHEQPSTIRRTLEGRYNFDTNTIHLDLPQSFEQKIQKIDQVIFVGCGTSYHAGCIAAHFLEEVADISAKAQIASEFRYQKKLYDENTLVIAISQSGETADTIAAIKEIKHLQCTTLAITNVTNSSIIRESDHHLMTQAGPEISVCSTKAFTSQLTLLYLLSLYLKQVKKGATNEIKELVASLRALPILVEKILKKKGTIEEIAKQFADFDKILFIGRQYMFFAALESSLKLKEISYKFSLSYPAGELKHGPLALIDPNTLTVALMGNKKTFAKTCSNIQEIQARQGKVFALIDHDMDVQELNFDAKLLIENGPYDFFSPILYSVALQLFAYYVAAQNGCDIDYPRNLAKSVTVE